MCTSISLNKIWNSTLSLHPESRFADRIWVRVRLRFFASLLLTISPLSLPHVNHTLWNERVNYTYARVEEREREKEKEREKVNRHSVWRWNGEHEQPLRRHKLSHAKSQGVTSRSRLQDTVQTGRIRCCKRWSQRRALALDRQIQCFAEQKARLMSKLIKIASNNEDSISFLIWFLLFFQLINVLASHGHRYTLTHSKDRKSVRVTLK